MLELIAKIQTEFPARFLSVNGNNIKVDPEGLDPTTRRRLLGLSPHISFLGEESVTALDINAQQVCIDLENGSPPALCQNDVDGSLSWCIVPCNQCGDISSFSCGTCCQCQSIDIGFQCLFDCKTAAYHCTVAGI